ncbi:unnamed protein product [Brassicogethes aeneus]|uniref:Uncharacterized protein n=1 Tax=Brassicogethes aeneus TaxID=1431903 RepID=A0A9P0AW39_BRAAE|nr:unnamed protein product [Brassicogethes aeneus]
MLMLGLRRDTNDTLRDTKEIKRKQVAEAKLYQQWRMNIPIVSNSERAYSNRNMKLSCLDQQIEKRMKRERDEEEAKKILKEREETLKKQRELEKD